MKKRPAKRLVKNEDVAQVTNLQHEQVRNLVTNQTAVTRFLRTLADQAADDPGTHPEIVKSATLIAVFLEKQSAAIRAQYPDAFTEQNRGTAEAEAVSTRNKVSAQAK